MGRVGRELGVFKQGGEEGQKRECFVVDGVIMETCEGRRASNFWMRVQLGSESWIVCSVSAPCIKNTGQERDLFWEIPSTECVEY